MSKDILIETNKYQNMREQNMNYKTYAYVFVILLVMWAMESLNISGIFKKNRK